jgi:SAM-dependent MidA family methyltransferase
LAGIVDQLRNQIQQQGPLSFRDYMEEVLRFYYASPRSPIGTEGDFYTSSDLDPIFGRLIAQQFERWAANLGSFTVVELGAGKGVLARDILQHFRCPYLILERSSAMRARQRKLLRDYDVRWIDELPKGLTGCIFSNEFFDALPVHRLVRRGGVLKEIFVTDQFTEIEGDVTPAVGALYERPGGPRSASAVASSLNNFPLLQEGQHAEVNLEARRWIREIAASIEKGYHLAIDYGYLNDEFYAQPRGTVMCYWRHQAVEDPYTRIGEQDITAHVNFSDLMEAGDQASLKTVSLTTQMDYLVGLGILDEIGRLAAAGDAASMQRLVQIKKLIVPGRMGERFKVLVQTKR